MSPGEGTPDPDPDDDDSDGLVCGVNVARKDARRDPVGRGLLRLCEDESGNEFRVCECDSGGRRG